MASYELLRKLGPESSQPNTAGYNTTWKESSGLSMTTRPLQGGGVGSSSLAEKCCAYCLSAVSKPSTCSQCRSAYYCGRTCQRNHWKVHKHECGKKGLLDKLSLTTNS